MSRYLRFFLIVAALCALAACSSSTDPEAPQPPTEWKASGRIILPAGLGTDPAVYSVICGADSSAVGSDGTFSNVVESGGPSLAILRSAAGNAVLFGFVDPGAPAANRISSQETAVALLFFALETWGLSGSERAAIVTELRAHSATPILAQAIETELARDLGVLAAEDSPVLSHIETAMATIRGTARARQAAMSLSEDKATNSNILAEPSAAQSGVLVGPNTAQDGTGLQITNQRRRNVWYYAYKVGYEDENGNAFDVDPPQAIREGFLTGTGGLQSSSAILIDWATGNLDFNDKALETPIDLQVSAGESKAFFDVVVAGAHVPGVTNTPAWYNSGDARHAAWRTSAEQMTTLTFIKDVFLPVFFSIVRPLQSLALDINPIEAASMVETIVATLPGVGPQIRDGEYLSAAYTIIKNIPANADLRQELAEFVGGFIASNSPFDVDRALDLLTSVNMAALIADLGLQGFDTFWVFNDMLDAHMMDRWDVTAIPVTLLLATERDVLNETEPDTRLTARVPGYPENEPFCFRWTFTGEGELSDFLGQSISSGESMMTTEREVLYGITPAQIVTGVLANIECVAYFPVAGESCSQEGGRAGEGAIAIVGEVAGCGLYVSSFRDGIYTDKLSATVSAFGCNDIEIGCLRYTLEGPGCLRLEEAGGCGGSSDAPLVTDQRIIFYEVDALVPDAVGTITVEFFDAACGEIVGSTTLDVGAVAIPHRNQEWEDPCAEGSLVTPYETAEFGLTTSTVNVSGQMGSVVEFEIDVVFPANSSYKSLTLFVPRFGPFDQDDIKFSSDQVSVNSVGSYQTTIFRIGEHLGWPPAFVGGYQIEIGTRVESFKVWVPTDPYRDSDGDVTPCRGGGFYSCCGYIQYDALWGNILTGPLAAVKIDGSRGVFEIGGNR